MGLIDLYQLKQNKMVSLYQRLKASVSGGQSSAPESFTTTKQKSSPQTAPFVNAETALASYSALNEVKSKSQKREFVKHQIRSMIVSSETYRSAKRRANSEYVEEQLNEFVSEACKMVKSDTDVYKFVSTVKNILDNNVLTFMSGYFLRDFSEFFKNSESMDSLNYLIKIVDRKDVLAKVVKADNLNPQKVELLKSRVGAVSLLNSFSIKNILSQSNKEWGLVKEKGLFELGLVCASDNNDINNLFLNSLNISPYCLKNLEKAIKSQCDNNPEQIKKLVEKLCEHKEGLSDLVFSDLKSIDIDSYADLGHNIKAKFAEHDGYDVHYRSIFNMLRKHNKPVAQSLLCLKDIDIRTMRDTLRYCDTEEKSQEIYEMLSDIKNGKRNILELPFVKYSKVNENVLKLKGTDYRSYAKDTDLNKISAETKQGEVVFVGKKTYINDKGEMTELQMDSATFKKLFPPFESQIMRQGNLSTDCMFLSHELTAFLRNPLARPRLLKTIKQDGDDIVVTLPKHKNLPVRFFMGVPDASSKEYHVSNTADGIVLLEQAMINAGYADAHNIKDPSIVSFDYALRHLPETLSLCDIILPDDNKGKFYHEAELSDILRKYAGRKDVLLGARTQWRFDDVSKGVHSDYGIVQDHAYYIENVDLKNQVITLVNPFNSLHSVDVPFKVFADYFRNVHVTEL